MGLLDLLVELLNFSSYKTLKGLESVKFNILPGREGFGTGYTSKRTKVKLYKTIMYTAPDCILSALCSTTVPVLWTAPLAIIV